MKISLANENSGHSFSEESIIYTVASRRMVLIIIIIVEKREMI